MYSEIYHLFQDALDEIWPSSEEIAIDNTSVRAVVHLPYAEVNRVAGMRPTCTIREDDSTLLHDGSVITMRGSLFHVQSINPDGAGLVTLELYKDHSQAAEGEAGNGSGAGDDEEFDDEPDPPGIDEQGDE